MRFNLIVPALGLVAVTSVAVLAHRERLSPEERAAKKAEVFAKADANGDGSLTAEEFAGLVQLMHQERAQRGFAAADANGDGAVTAEEFQAARPHRGGCKGPKD
jgi:hypothetical protein